MFRRLFLLPTSHKYIQLIRYGMVVAIAFPIDFGLLYVFTDFYHMHYLLSATLAFTISMVANFALSIAWVFSERMKRALWKEALAFGIIGFVGLGLTDLIIWLCTSVAGLYYMGSKLIAVSIVFFWSFGARRFMFQRSFRSMLPEKLSNALPKI